MLLEQDNLTAIINVHFNWNMYTLTEIAFLFVFEF